MSVGKSSISRMEKTTTAETVKAGIVSLAPEVPEGTPATPAKKAASAKKPAKKAPATAAKRTPAKKAEKPAAAVKTEKNGYIRVSVGDEMPYYLL